MLARQLDNHLGLSRSRMIGQICVTGTTVHRGIDAYVEISQSQSRLSFSIETRSLEASKHSTPTFKEINLKESRDVQKMGKFLDLRINPCELFLFVTHYLSFSCTPINRHRMLEDLRLNIEKVDRHQEPATPLQDSSSWFLKLVRRPIEVARSIKRYHLSDNWFLVVFVGHIVILLHISIKCAVHSFYTGSDMDRMRYFNTIYYPHLAGALPEPFTINNVMFVEISCCLLMRLLSACKLIRRSIANEHQYKELYITQVNFASLTLCNLTVREWIEVYKKCVEHDKRIKEDYKARKAHLKLNPFLYQRLEQLTEKDLLFRLNIIDFNQCFESIDSFDSSNRKRKYHNWHYALPLHKLSPQMMRISMVSSIIIAISVCFGYLMVVIGIIFLELRSVPGYFEIASFNDLTNVFKLHFTRLDYQIRVVEEILLVVLQIPRQYDSFLVTMDQCILITRANKLIEAFKTDLRLCKDHEFFAQTGHERDFLEKLLSQEELISYKQHPFENQSGSSEIRELNSRVQSYVRLVSLLHSEFLSMRRNHASLLNIIIIGNGISMTYMLSRLMSETSIIVIMIMSMGLSVNFANCLQALMFSAAIEKGFKNLYSLMSKLQVNKSGRLTRKTVGMLLSGCEAFENKEDRAFLIADLYAITVDSVAPVSI